MRNFKDHMIKRHDLVRLEAEAINRAIGNTYRVLSSDVVKPQQRIECERAVGPALKGQTLKARGAYQGPKGGVIPGARVF